MTALILLGWMLIALVSTYGADLYRRRVARNFDIPDAEGVAVLIPIKGAPGQQPALQRFLATCLAQRGVAFRIVFAVESEGDPAAAPIRILAASDDRVSLVVAGRSSIRGQKIQNQLAALATLRPADRFVVFADADVAFAEDWLAQLLRPLQMGRAEIASGYRWILPDDDHPASRLCALMDWGVATAPRAQRWNLCWGGSMGVSRAALVRLDLSRCWDRAVLDDIVLTRAARRLGIAVHAPHRVLVPSPVRHDWRSLLNFGRRQYLMVRIHAPLHWALAGVTLGVPALGGFTALAAALRGNGWALGAIAATLILQQVRASLRLAVARSVLPAEAAARSAALLRRDRWLLPAAHLAHLAIWLASGIGRTMMWGGRRYRLTGPGRVDVLERAEGIEPS